MTIIRRLLRRLLHTLTWRVVFTYWLEESFQPKGIKRFWKCCRKWHKRMAQKPYPYPGRYGNSPPIGFEDAWRNDIKELLGPMDEGDADHIMDAFIDSEPDDIPATIVQSKHLQMIEIEDFTEEEIWMVAHISKRNKKDARKWGIKLNDPQLFEKLWEKRDGYSES